MPDARAQVRRLHEHRIAERRLELLRDGVAAAAASRGAARRDTGRRAGPAAANTTFMIALSMPTADASTPAPTYGTLASSSSPWIVPSSPYGPCSTGKITSRFRPVTTACSVLVAGVPPAIDRENGLLARPRDQVDLAAAAAGPRRIEARLFDDLRRRHRGRRAIGERPPSVLFNPDRHRLVPRAVEVGEHRRGRRQRHFVLARASAVQHADAESFHSRRIQEARSRVESPRCQSTALRSQGARVKSGDLRSSSDIRYAGDAVS